MTTHTAPNKTPNKKPLTGKQSRYLRGLAHHLKITVMVGGDRITEGVLQKVDHDLHHHELIKIKLLDADQKELTAARERLLEHTGAHHIQTIGHMIILFSRNHEKPKVPAMPGEKLKRKFKPTARRGPRQNRYEVKRK